MTRFVSAVSRSLLLISAVFVAALLVVPQATQAQRTTFTYQGYLEEGGAPAQDDKDLRFALYDSQSGGSQVGQTITKQDVGVADGVFNVELDFGAQFAEDTRYLEVGVRDAGSSSSFTSLSPREVIRPAPIASSLPNVTVDGSGNVGIGTTSPSSRLTVDGPIEATSGGVTLPDGTVLAGSDDLGEGGDITAVNTAGALQGGGSSGDVTLRLATSCSSGEIFKWDGSSWVCSSDDAGGGLPTTGSGAFDLSNDEGVAAPGTFGTGSIPTSGSGTRMMWYPAKGAFRVGQVGNFKDGTQWDASKVGDYSVAFGVDTKASGDRSTAMGSGTIASGTAATAMGFGGATASAKGATAMGVSTTASGNHATAMGKSTTAATDESLSIGECNSTNTSEDGTLFGVGNGTWTSGSCSTRSDALVLDKDGGLAVPGTFGTGSIPVEGAGTRMMWYPAKAAFRAGQVGRGKDGTQWDDSKVGDHSVAFGLDTKASDRAATAIGLTTTASGDAATAMGSFTTASGDRATAMGKGTTANAFVATAMGNQTTASGQRATAMGERTTASGDRATAMGERTTAATDRSLSIGGFNSANTSADNTLFVAGNGSGNNSRSDALVLKNDGDLAVGPSDPQDLRLHVTKDKPNAGVSDNPGANMVLFENTNDGTRPDVLGLQAGPTDPGSGVTYISFYQRDGTSVGGIEGNGSGGVNYATSGSDYAEELPVRSGSAPATPTDLVAVRGGAVSLDTDGAQRLMIVTDRAAVTGNVSSAENRPRVPVAFIGQVPVQLNGTAAVGDLIVASGQDDGTARAISPAQYRPSKHGPIAGRAWSAKPTSGPGTVTVAVGLDQSGVVAARMQDQQREIDALRDRVQKLENLEARLARLEASSEDGWQAGIPGSGMLLGLLLGGLLGAGLLSRRRT